MKHFPFLAQCSPALSRAAGLPPRSPITVVFAILMISASFVGCQREEPHPGKGTPVSDMRIKADWAAWVNKMPPGPASFHVAGTLHMPHPGFEVVLVPTRPQGINPKILMLNLMLRELDGMWAQVLTDIETKYVIDPYDGDYRQVHIFYPNGDSVFLELNVAH